MIKRKILDWYPATREREKLQAIYDDENDIYYPLFANSINEFTVGLGMISGMELKVEAGYYDSVPSDGPVPLAYVTAVQVDKYTYPYLTEAKVLAIRSFGDDAEEDDGVLLGDGAHKVTVEGLDANYNEISEEVTLEGEDTVHTQQQFLRINDAYITAAGSLHVNQGLIIIGTESPTTYLDVLINGFGRSATGVYTVPAGKRAAISTSWGSFITDTGYVVLSSLDGDSRVKTYSAWTGVGLGETVELINAKGRIFEERTDIQMEALSISGNGVVLGGTKLIIMDA